jgi:DNA repair protein RecN (Recombination protein N)
MLAIKSLVSREQLLPTVVFDEIDSGISGDIAGKVGKILKEMSEHHQLIVISHLPQIAARADYHFKVYKSTDAEKTFTLMKPLDDEERVDEIAKLLSDEKVSQAAMETARELLKPLMDSQL